MSRPTRYRSQGYLVAIGAASMIMLTSSSFEAQSAFDHEYPAYAALLRTHLRGTRVSYGDLKTNRGALDRVVDRLGSVSSAGLEGWSRDQQIAFWINAYNVFTLRAIVDHYPIEGSWFSLHPKDSIRQIDGVWDTLRWHAAGRDVTLDQIEHEILRPTFKEPRVHFAVNCASVSCPPLRHEPYIASRLDAQLDDQARQYLASDQGLQVRGERLMVSSILDWYGEDFLERFASKGPAGPGEQERAILGVIGQYGPPAAAALAKRADTDVGYLDYDWSLNDLATVSSSSQ